MGGSVLVFITSLAMAQDPSCVAAVEDLFPADGALVPADVLPQVVFRADCNLDRTQVELLDESGQVVDRLERVQTHLLEWDVALVPGQTYTLRLVDEEELVAPAHTFTLLYDTDRRPDATAAAIGAWRDAFEDEADVELDVMTNGDANLRIYTYEPFQVHRVSEASTRVVHRVLPVDGQACVDEVELRAANGERLSLPGSFCAEVSVLETEETELPSSSCSQGSAPSGWTLLAWLRRRTATDR